MTDVPRTCPYCAAELAGDPDVCPECGRVLHAPEPVPVAPPSVRRVAGGLGCVLVGALLALLGIVLLFGMMAGGVLG